MSDTRSDSGALRATSDTVDSALSRNVPQEVTYDGQQFIEIKLAPSDFIASRAAADAAAKAGN